MACISLSSEVFIYHDSTACSEGLIAHSEFLKNLNLRSLKWD